MCRWRDLLLCFVYMYIIKEQQAKVVNVKFCHNNLLACKGINREYPKSSFFTLLAGAPSLEKFLYSINVLPTKRCLFSDTLVRSSYVYFTWLYESVLEKHWLNNDWLIDSTDAVFYQTCSFTVLFHPTITAEPVPSVCLSRKFTAKDDNTWVLVDNWSKIVFFIF